MKVLNENIVVFLVICYLMLFTGIASDDYIFIDLYSHDKFNSFYYPLTNVVATPILHYTHVLFYKLFNLNYLLYDTLKILWIFISFLMIKKFFSLFISPQKSLLVSFLFIYFPTHDSSTYWFLAQYLMLTISFYMFAYYLAENNKLALSFIFAFLASFVSYGSTPVAVSLFLLFLLQKEYKKSILILIPNLLYIVYYIYLTKFLMIGTARLHDTNFIVIIKQYILQMGTFLDSSIGPSFWFKIYFAFHSLTVVSIVVGIFCVILFYQYYKPKKEKLNKVLLVSLLTMTCLAFGIFALTGFYPQLVFNLGNRVSIYGALLLVFLIVMLLMNDKKYATIIFSISIFTILGISDHWKEWNKVQLQILKNITLNKDIKKFDRTKQLFVTYNQFSKFGIISHIEFFTEGIPNQIFKLATKKTYKVSTLNGRFYYKNNQIIDRKYNFKIEVKDDINVYDSKRDVLLVIKKENIQEYINNLPKDNRHWLQLLDKDNFIMKIVLKLMPRLEYVL